MAASHWIANVTNIARAQRRMIYDLTFSIVATRSWTWINAFVIYAGAIRWTFAIQNAFWTAFNVRITIILWYARTSSGTIVLLTNGICSARRWLAWMCWFSFQKNKTKRLKKKDRTELRDNSSKYLTQNVSRTTAKRIADETIQTTTVRPMIENCALGIWTTRSNAWIFAFITNTS